MICQVNIHCVSSGAMYHHRRTPSVPATAFSLFSFSPVANTGDFDGLPRCRMASTCLQNSAGWRREPAARDGRGSCLTSSLRTGGGYRRLWKQKPLYFHRFT
ncbi:hypothetical protein KCP71_24285 [Salmonella enterica subsp. enterica]|nr:hypothetical protein KCP71_24285 [Salmonella enterica subsp. enterica]